MMIKTQLDYKIEMLSQIVRDAAFSFERQPFAPKNISYIEEKIKYMKMAKDLLDEIMKELMAEKILASEK